MIQSDLDTGILTIFIVDPVDALLVSEFRLLTGALRGLVIILSATAALEWEMPKGALAQLFPKPAIAGALPSTRAVALASRLSLFPWSCRRRRSYRSELRTKLPSTSTRHMCIMVAAIQGNMSDAARAARAAMPSASIFGPACEAAGGQIAAAPPRAASCPPEAERGRCGCGGREMLSGTSGPVASTPFLLSALE